ncbi:MAG TPA: aminotransferase V [Acholeplasmatales bacterium]|nr:MAG: hypothetical protein A2Y16_05770 [Tenericutes bacterium GWF2_57_13]HAQ55851.1 aminotransferase V [Acholeplasmatales bacterium]
MIYLDYSATTPPSDTAIDSFVEASRRLFANPNSLHTPGREAERAVTDAANGILRTLNLDGYEVIFTSGASEANNLAIKGYALRNRKHGKHLVTSPFEHSSVTACFGYLERLGFEVDIAETDADGRVTPDRLAKVLREDTILVSIANVNSELGIVQPVSALAALVARLPHAVFHSDVTQAVGKIPVAFTNIGLASLSAHKFYGLKGVGALIRRHDVLLEPIIHGGKSTTQYRSGTPSAPLAISLEKTLEAAVLGLSVTTAGVSARSTRLLKELALLPGVAINSPTGAVPHILNLSVLDRDADDMLAFLDERGICVSKQTACSSGSSRSEAVFRLTGDERRGRTSLRVSLSHLTTDAEIDLLVDALRAEAGN